MADATTTPLTAASTAQTSRDQPRRNRRGRGGRPDQALPRSNAGQGILAFRPASVAPLPQNPTTARTNATQPTDASSQAHRRPTKRGTRGGQNGQTEDAANVRVSAHVDSMPLRRGGRGGGGNSTQVAGRRQFGGQLTSGASGNGGVASSAQLQADASEFVPGQQHQPARRQNRRPKQNNHNHAQGNRARRGSVTAPRSNAEDIMTRTHEDIASGAYECLICSESVHARSKIYSCHTCWTVMHVGCARQWESQEASRVPAHTQPDGELPLPQAWRCPGCRSPQEQKPSYTCWCGKEAEPTSIPGLPPHSCGQSCGEERTRPKRCPHACELICHAGPHPICTAMGPEVSCYCGKRSSRKRCVDTNYDEGYSCGEICGEMMPCGDHTCSQPCHQGLCGACEVRIESRCYCGKVEKMLLCYDKESELISVMDNTKWTGIFDCGSTCERVLDCGKHLCQETCHQQGEEGSHHCPRAVDVISHCACGKTSLSELGVERTNCDDPIPACDKVCARTLPCGHSCEQKCHSGKCTPCFKRMDVNCVCGRTTTQSICLQGGEFQPQCMRVCRSTLNCGRHACEEHCCSGERKAAERLASKKKRRGLDSAAPRQEDFEPEHICVKLCGRLLSCGNPDHVCQELCHKGKCKACPNAIFDEVSCHCGRTVLYPPLPCGTRPPPCRYQCQRSSPCGLHPQVPHNCHSDDEKCPPCVFLVSKPCMCGKKTLKNQPCFKENVGCGLICGRKLGCGKHTCRKTCHLPGECEDAGGDCGQACGMPKPKCGHPDLDRCHAPSACKQDKPCQSKMVVVCECARLRLETKCLASRSSDGNLFKKLSCDDECARQARNRVLADALNVNPDEHTNDHVPYEDATLRLAKEVPNFAAEYEQKLRIFAADSSERRLRFAPMKQTQRAFVHALAQDFGFESESLDPEPHRHVVLFKTPKFVAAPMKTIAECMRIRTLQGKLKAPVQVDSAGASDSEVAPTIDEQILFNGFLLTKPRFALTIDEVQTTLAPALRTNSSIAFDVAFLPSEEVVLRAKSSSPTTTLAPEVVQSALKGMKANLASLVGEKGLAEIVRLCALDSSLNTIRREVDANSSAGGWSMVAAKAQARPRQIPRQSTTSSKNGFLVLGKKRQGEKKAPQLRKEESVADDWEEAVRKEEEEQEERDTTKYEDAGPSLGGREVGGSADVEPGDGM